MPVAPDEHGNPAPIPDQRDHALRVLFVVEAFPKLSETFIVQLALECQRQGCEIEVLTLQPGDDAALTEELAGSGLLERVRCLDVPLGSLPRAFDALSSAVRLLGTGHNPLDLVDTQAHGASVRNLRGLMAASRLARSEPLGSFDVVHAHFGKGGVLAMQLIDAGLLAGPIIVSFHGQDVTAYPQRFGHDVYKSLFERAAYLTAPSGHAVDRLVELGASEQGIMLMPYAFDSDAFRYRPRKPPVDRPLQLLTVGRLVEKKGTQFALEAVALLRKELSAPIHLEIVGDGPLRNQLENLAEQLGVSDVVSFTGAVPPAQMPAAFDRADVFVLPSIVASDGDHEGRPVVLLEAQASGLPVVATRHGGIPEGVLEGESAILVEERNADQLAAAIRKLVDDPSLIPEMGAAGRRFVESRFTRERVGAEVVDLYRQVSA